MYNELIVNAEKKLNNLFKKIEEISLYNQEKVLKCFQKNKVALRHFSSTTGYGYSDEGKENLNKIFAQIFNADKAIVSPNIVSGTHALTLCLFGILRPNDLLLTISGTPYDTLIDVIEGDNIGSLKDFNINYSCINLKNNKFDYKSIEKFVKKNKPKIIYIQRSRGYEWRSAFSIEDIKNVVFFLRNIGFNNCIMVDNCYGEFLEKLEPTDVGVDIIAGSLIKNPGGGLAQTGGYIAGKENYIHLIENRLTAPSIGSEVGSYANSYQYFYQGVFLAPHTVSQALKGSLLFGEVFNRLGYETSPKLNALPGDIIRAIKFNTKDELVSFINAVQAVSPVDSFVSVEPWDMPGYESQVIMAAGCFVQGASIELSADAPIREPYIAYIQGGLTYEHCKIALKQCLTNLKL